MKRLLPFLSFLALAPLHAWSQAPTGPAADASRPGPSGPARSGGGAQAPSVLRTYSLASVLPVFDGDETPSLSLQAVPAIANMANEVDTHPDPGGAAASPDLIVDLLTQVLGDDLRFEGREIDSMQNDQLVVLAPEEVQAKVKAVLDALEQVLSARAVVSVDVLDADGPGKIEWPTGSVLPAAEAQRLVDAANGRGATFAHYEVVVSAGRTATIDQTQRVQVLSDYDVEIAQAAAIWDPIIGTAEVGHRMLLRGLPSADGVRLAVVMKAVEQVGDVTNRPFVTGMLLTGGDKPGWAVLDGPKTLQSIELLDQGYAFSGYLDASSALVCASELETGGQSHTQLVVLRLLSSRGAAAVQTPLAGGKRRLVAVNQDLLSPPTVSTGFLDPGSGVGDPYSYLPLLTADVPPSKSLFLLDWMKYRFNVWRTMGPWVLAVSDPDWDHDAPQALAALVSGWTPAAHTGTVQLDLVGSGAGETHPVRVIVPGLSGEPVAAVVGTSRSGILDYDVEVAQFAAVADPVPFSLFSGLAATAVGNAGGDGAAFVDVQARGFVPAGKPTTLEVEADQFRYFDQERLDHLRCDERRELSADGTATIGATAKSGARQGLRLVVGVH